MRVHFRTNIRCWLRFANALVVVVSPSLMAGERPARFRNLGNLGVKAIRIILENDSKRMTGPLFSKVVHFTRRQAPLHGPKFIQSQPLHARVTRLPSIVRVEDK